ncbi:hypothetical protein OC25_03835 [Pedobacter kyungheensis]|uniref:Uncharacterized protein n=2 Tax=Pedobacter TaxID=84567 RepID=A0A1G6K2X2_9SPHI|nr:MULTISPECIES: hypothetical protein [Pedobacter]KIA96219.1 hypothetical protein OC25_03835 [Pedobacter kyungheensis]SDC25392.1 hypothetical protein SAMN04488024_101640 [Pedobacter soli]
MKTNIKTTILGIALMASVTGAFASDISEFLNGKKANTHSWQKYLPDGTTPDGPAVLGDSTGPFAEQCEGDQNVCAIGTPIVSGQTEQVLKYVD